MKDLVTLFATNHIGNVEREREREYRVSSRLQMDDHYAPKSGSFVNEKVKPLTDCEVIELNIQRAFNKAA
jgi:hypothetical protein